MKILFRISDNDGKPRLPGASKEFCLQNAINSFPSNEFIILADNCGSKTTDFCKSFGFPVINTELGNSGSFREALKIACNLNTEFVYMLEDDYVHYPRNDLSDLIKESLKITDYTTLFDHPDKYQSEYGWGEQTQVFRTNNTHWKLTISTTMTFATKVKTLREDYELWIKYTNDKIPRDHEAFCELNNRNRLLSSPVPGLSLHVDLCYSEAKSKLLIDDWAFELLEKHLSSKFHPDVLKQINPVLDAQPNWLKRLMIFGALVPPE